jgi:hypothetical protein
MEVSENKILSSIFRRKRKGGNMRTGKTENQEKGSGRNMFYVGTDEKYIIDGIQKV